jgi:hypothetical protein
MREAVRDGLVAGSVAAVAGGIPSTLHAITTGSDILESTRAAGSIPLPWAEDEQALLSAGANVHVAISLFWGVVLARVIPRSAPAPVSLGAGAVGGLAIAALDLGLIGRLFPRIRALPRGPQIADHVAFGAVVGAVLAWRRR